MSLTFTWMLAASLSFSSASSPDDPSSCCTMDTHYVNILSKRPSPIIKTKTKHNTNLIFVVVVVVVVFFRWSWWIVVTLSHTGQSIDKIGKSIFIRSVHTVSLDRSGRSSSSSADESIAPTGASLLEWSVPSLYRNITNTKKNTNESAHIQQ